MKKGSPYADFLFPTDWQNVLFLNYGKVRTASLARVLGTDEKTIEEEAARLGLGEIKEDVRWTKRGYITAIRNNWHFLPLEQIIDLLDTDASSMEKILLEEDFLSVKLGEKPDIGRVAYRPLSARRKRESEKIGKIVQREYVPALSRPFEFNYDECDSPAEDLSSGERVVYLYDAVYGEHGSLPDGELSALAAQGVTGIWMPALLSDFAEHPFAPRPKEEREKRTERMRGILNQCAAHGLKVFLYLNEPRACKTEDLPPQLRGHTVGEYSSLCMGDERTKKYLTDATEQLCRALPGLGGIITITMSENQTHCRYWGETNCPRCKARSMQSLAAEVNNCIAEGARRAGGTVRVVANLWGWSHFMGWTRDAVREGIDLLDGSVEIMAVSEYGKKICKGGIESEIIDYSISNPGPSEDSEYLMRYAASRGRKVWAKIQVNNSWECSSVPYIPAYGLVAEHLDRLSALGVNDFMLCWTLGGYPSLGLRLATQYYRAGKGVDLAAFYARAFGEKADAAAAAVQKIERAFAEFPFSLNVLYFAPHTLGGGELWSTEEIGLPATMVCFSYDDTEKYAHPYGEEIYLSQMKKLSEGFCEGVSLLERAVAQDAYGKEVCLFARAAGLHYVSAYHHARFTAEKKRGFPDRVYALQIVKEEEQAVRELYRLQAADARIGFESSNQYYYNENSLLAKIVNLNRVAQRLEKTEKPDA